MDSRQGISFETAPPLPTQTKLEAEEHPQPIQQLEQKPPEQKLSKIAGTTKGGARNRIFRAWNFSQKILPSMAKQKPKNNKTFEMFLDE